MDRRAKTAVTVLTLATALTACGSTTSASRPSPTSIQVTQPRVVVDVRNLERGSSAQQIAATIVSFYRATWQNQRSVVCSLFSPAGVTGFLKAAKVAFPSTVNSTTTCEQAMTYFNATLTDSVNTLQQAGVNVSGNVLDNVGVQNITVHGTSATAQAPEGVEEFIKPKLFTLVRVNNRWLIDGTSALGKTLPQILGAAKAKGELRPKTK